MSEDEARAMLAGMCGRVPGFAECVRALAEAGVRLVADPAGVLEPGLPVVCGFTESGAAVVR